MKSAASAANAETMSIGAHLNELRSRLLKILALFIVATVALVPFTDEIFTAFSAPLTAVLPEGTQLLAVGVVSPVLGPLKTVLFCSFCLTLPFAVWELWTFAAPGLYRNERRALCFTIVSSMLMFACGVAYCYLVVFKMVFPVIASFAPSSVSFAPDLEAYLGFCIRMFLAFGICFETPVAVVALAAAGMVQLATLKRIRKYIVVAAVGVAAVLTPPDVASQLLLALPLIALYESGLLIAPLFCRAGAAKARAAA
ncbi:MAG: twin-arginine translocase subunit TatC [Succinivibrio sp.]|jgi:sec-independent protein translocase protein TatC|nr:twin-arginine translocase subunit TatC [Succinivibrio sp.]